MGERKDDHSGPSPETDERFVSGEWRGFFLQRALGGRQWMDLELTFAAGLIKGEGRDIIGEFVLRGRYDVKTGKVTIHKRYVGKHDVFYAGAADGGQGIWGLWRIGSDRGGWHIWPRSMGDPTQAHEAVEVEASLEAKHELEVAVSD